VLDLLYVPPDNAFAGDRGGPWSLWRYRAALPVGVAESAWQALSLGEGGTPLVADDAQVFLKLDFLMPTLSFKDRGSVLLVATALELGARRLVADSSGNAGVSLAAYAARAGIAAEVFVPAATSEAKVAQLRRFGAEVWRVGGTRADAAAAAIDRVESTRSFYASHVYNPMFHHGTKTFAYEVWEQLGRRVPDTVVVPAGNGTLLLGARLGFDDLLVTGAADRVPRLVAAQAERCAPLAAAIGSGAYRSPGPTLAEGIAIAAPPRLQQMRDAVERSGGAVITAGDDAVRAARAELAGRGIDVEPTAAVAYAAWRSWPAGAAAGSTVIALTGAGLKAAPPH
jgi:threonine synthase